MSVRGQFLTKLGIDARKGIVMNVRNGAVQTDSLGGFKIHTLSQSLADDASVDVTPKGPGFLYLHDGAAEGGVIAFLADGTTFLMGSNSTNIAATDSDTDLCAFQNGSAIRIRNRLGGVRTVTAIFFYQITVT